MKEKLDKTSRSLIPIWISLIPVCAYLTVMVLLGVLLRRDGNWFCGSNEDPDELIYYNVGSKSNEQTKCPLS
jgi:hypothetical protein